MSFGVAKPYFGVDYAKFLCTNFSVKDYAIMDAKKRLLA
jgi:hypothetical protein